MGRNQAAIDAQQTRLEAMYRRHVGPNTPYALVDFPNHSNVGDSAIWLGEVASLRKITGRDPSYVSTEGNFNVARFRAACPEGVLFIHGGGNLGDIWPRHQDFRERLMRDIRERRIVQLPQSMKFYDQKRFDAFARMTVEHPDFHICVRDQQSYDLANSHFGGTVELVPDCAFGMGAQQRDKPETAILMLLRTDSEKSEYDRDRLRRIPGAVEADWLDDDDAFHRIVRRRKWIQRFWSGIDSDTGRLKWYNHISQLRVTRGLSLLSRGEAVITDRLHGHILSLLLDIPHVALDNSYGKVSGLIAAWTKDYPDVRTATTAEDAVEKLSTLRVPATTA